MLNGIYRIFGGNEGKIRLIAFIIAAFTFIVYLPALKNGFVHWDDQFYVYENPYIRSLDAAGFKWVFSLDRTVWVPLTKLSHAFTYAVCGLEPFCYHLINNILHALNAFLVTLLAFRLIEIARPASSYVSRNAVICAGITGMLFGIHPIHVESVAWVTERKDVLFLFFTLLSLLQYLRYAAAQGWGEGRGPYLRSISFFAMAVTLPAVLILLDLYPLMRLRPGSQLKPQYEIFAEKIPFFFLSFAVSLITLLFYWIYGIEVLRMESGLSERMLVGARAFFFYIVKMLFPTNLIPIYPYPSGLTLFSFEYITVLTLFIAVTTFCVYRWKDEKVWLTAWAFYIITLFPVSGVLKYGYFAAAADRYTYLPGLAPSLLLSIGIVSVYGRIAERNGVRLAQAALAWLLILAIPLLSVLTVRQIKIWENTFTLWNAQLKVFPESHLALMNIADAYNAEGRHDKAIEVLNRVQKIYDDDPVIYFIRGGTYGKLGLHGEAIRDIKEAVRLNPEMPGYYNELGVAYGNQGDYALAIESLNTAIKIDPHLSGAFFHRGVAYYRLGRMEDALADFREAAKLGNETAKTYLSSINMN